MPQFLQEELKGKVLCSQPRRLAVVSVAKRVAEEVGCRLGGFVGYINAKQADIETGAKATGARKRGTKIGL